MSASLRDQLLGMGLARPQPEKSDKPKKHPRKPRKRQDATARSAASSTAKPKASDQAKAAPASAKAAKKSRPKPTPGVPSPEDLRRKQVKAEIKALIEANSLNDWHGEIAYNYQIGERIKQLLINDEARQKLIDGQLSITRLNRITHVVPSPLKDDILALNAQWLFITGGQSSGDEASEGSVADDPYADYAVPDDIVW